MYMGCMSPSVVRSYDVRYRVLDLSVLLLNEVRVNIRVAVLNVMNELSNSVIV
jgi:hypothetical protein